MTFSAALTEIAGERGATRWTFDATDEERMSAVRREYLAQLRNVGFSTVELYAAQLIFGELIGNVCRYAPPTVDVMLDISGSAAVLHVLDSGEGFEFRPRLPADPLAERGRGLFLVKAFADELSMERRRTRRESRARRAAGTDALPRRLDDDARRPLTRLRRARGAASACSARSAGRTADTPRSASSAW